MIPVWLKNKKTGGYDLIPYDLMVKGSMICKGRQVWYAHRLHLELLEQADPTGETVSKFITLHRMLDQYPEYFLQVIPGTYLFMGKKWGMMDRFMNHIGRVVVASSTHWSYALANIIRGIASGIVVGALTVGLVRLCNLLFDGPG